MQKGCRHYYVDATGDIYYPTATGGKTNSSASSNVAGARWCRVAGILVLAADASASTITIYTDDGSDGGTAVTGLAFTIAASQACPFPIPLGDAEGIAINGPIGATTSTSNTKFLVFYDKIM